MAGRWGAGPVGLLPLFGARITPSGRLCNEGAAGRRPSRQELNPAGEAGLFFRSRIVRAVAAAGGQRMISREPASLPNLHSSGAS